MVAKIAHLAQRPLSWRQPTLRDQGIPGKKERSIWRSPGEVVLEQRQVLLGGCTACLGGDPPGPSELACV